MQCKTENEEKIMKAYIINLADAVERKQHVKMHLSNVEELQLKWIDAIDGRKLTDQEKDELFDLKKFKWYYQRNIRNGEIGCTLSHQLCYKELLNSDDNMAIVFEDDILLTEPFEKITKAINVVMATSKPTVFLLSSWYWYTYKRRIDDEQFICRVIDARLAHAYVINKPAARIMSCSKPWFLADDWGVYRRKGIRIYSLMPSVVCQYGFHSSINTGEPTEATFTLSSWILNAIHSVPRKIAKVAGHYYL